MSDFRALGIDVGSTNTKVAFIDLTSTAVSPRAAAVATERTPADADGLVACVVRLVSQVVPPGVRPHAVGIASMAETGVPLDRSGTPLMELVRWDGHRAGAEASALSQNLGREALFAATGVRPSAKVPLATWAWLRAAHPEVMARMAYWAGAADLVALALTGQLVTDHTLAGRTMAYRTPGAGGLGAGGASPAMAGEFDADLLAAVGLTPSQLPRVAGPTEPSAHVGGSGGGRPPGLPAVGDHWADAREAFVRAGVSRRTPVVIAGHDHAVGAWAAGIRRPGDRADSVGTAEAVLTVLSSPPDPRRTADAGMSWVRTVSGVHDAVLAGTSSAGAMLGWLAERVGPEALQGALAEAARQHAADPTPTGVIVLPYLAGRQTPAPDASARVRVIPGDTPRSELVRAVAEGVCLQARWMLDAQAVLAGRGGGVSHEGARAGSPLRVLGGPAMAIPLWAETKRRVTPGSLRWVRAEEPVAMGAGLLALTRSGVLGADVGRLLSGEAPVLDSVDDQPRPAGRHAPGPGDGEYDAMYERFVAAALEPAQPA